MQKDSEFPDEETQASVHLPQPLQNRLEEIARKLQTTTSDLVSRIVHEAAGASREEKAKIKARAQQQPLD